jgi:Domain of unknown function (DUF4437)
MVKIVPEAQIHADDLAWRHWTEDRSAPFLASGTQGEAWVKVLSRDRDTGAESLLYKLDKGWSARSLENTVYENLFVLDGIIEVDGLTLLRNSYAYRPQGHLSHSVTSPTGATVFACAGGVGEPASKIAVPCLDTETMPWIPRPVGHQDARYFVKMLRGDEENLDTYYVMWATKGTETHKITAHDAPEEAFYLQGRTEFYDSVTEGRVIGTRGTYVHRGPMSAHGHITVHEDQIVFKHDYFTNEVEEAEEIFFSSYPVDTDAVRALKEGREPVLPKRW